MISNVTEAANSGNSMLRIHSDDTYVFGVTSQLDALQGAGVKGAVGAVGWHCYPCSKTTVRLITCHFILYFLLF